MDHLRAPSLQSLLESERGSTDSLLAESLQLEVEDLDDVEYAIPPTVAVPSLETVLSEFEADSDIASELGIPPSTLTPTPSIADDNAGVRSGGAGGSGSIMRFTTLQNVSAQISSAAERVNSGLASACAVAAFIAVGTSHGHILNFDVTQTLRWAYQDKHSNGAVSTLAFNTDSTRLLAGFARGLITMLDTQSGDVLRTLLDAITPNTGVLHVKWTSRPALALCSDSGGSVWSLSFTRKLGIRGCSSRCLFSGARGEVCAMEPLVMDSHGQHHELDQYCIAALATLSKYFIVTIRPRLRVIKYHTLQGPPDCLPMLAWQMVLIQAVDTTRSVDPVIVVGRGNQLFFHQLFMSNGRITFLYLRHITMQENLLSAHWLGPKCVGCLDISEIFHLIDIRSSKELECIDMANAGLVYGSAHFKGFATGGNVSPALALAGTHACYSSIAVQGPQLYILGARSLHIIGVRTWSERISFLVKNQRWQEACDLALEGYRVAAERPKRRHQAKERIIMLCKEYLAASTHAPDYCLGAVIKCLIAVGEIDFLWEQLWERVQHASSDLFLQYITEHIENDQIQQLSPLVSQALVEYWLQISPSKLEELILKLDWTCLDLNQVLRATKRYKLYRAQIYLNTHALNDYTVSLTELIPLVEMEKPDLGNCLLVYISSCLAGRGYPTGDIPSEMIQLVKYEVLNCLTSVHSVSSNGGGQQDLSMKSDLAYPYLRALLKFDTRETLNVISLAFQEKEFSGEEGFSQRKRIINILLEIMTPENATWAEIGCLLNFIAQQISLRCLPRDAQLLQTVLNYLAEENIANESARQHSERESAWHELLVNNCLEQISSDEEQLQLAKKAHCHYVEEYLMEKLERYETILDCYLSNQSRHDTMFAYIERHVGNPKRQIYQQVKTHFKSLLSINGSEITRIIDFHFCDKINELLDECLQDDEDLLFIFLNNLHKRRATNLSAENAEKLLQLLCKRQTPPQYVLEFLKENSNYRIDVALSIVQQYDDDDHLLQTSVIYLYEKQNNYNKAFDLALKQLKAIISTDEAEAYAKEVSALCQRASTMLPTTREREPFWFELLKVVLKREDLKSITKSMLRNASQYVDLANLVQLVMNMGNVSGNFGDIKDLLMSMLSNSRSETETLKASSDQLEIELHKKLAERKRLVCRGLWVTTMRCAICQNRLYNQDCILVLGVCGHAMHNKCAAEIYFNDFHQSSSNAPPPPPRSLQLHAFDNNSPQLSKANNRNSSSDKNNKQSNKDMENSFRCPQCYEDISNDYLSSSPLKLAQPSHRVVSTNISNYDITQGNMGALPLKAPPRRT